MRDLVVREAMRAMARDAAKRFRELVAAGEEIPYDVREPDQASPLAEYAPLTERFIREHALVLREVDSFGAACAAIESADLAGPYLEGYGIAVPPDPRGRAELAGTVFLCRLWLDSTDFSLDRERLAAAIGELERTADAGEGEIEVIVPLRGLQMPVVRLDLATATIVRADTVEVPAEARASEGFGNAAWEPTFLAVARVPSEPDAAGDEVPVDAGTLAVERFRTLISTLRLFKPGGVALGAHAWTRAGGDRWRRISTGAGRPRPGGYRLADTELGDLTAFSRALTARPVAWGRGVDGTPSALARSISRFEAGLERAAVLEALNDYLLAMRFLLEGGGPADLGLSMRVASLCAEPERRGEVKAVVDRAISLERELWSGEPAIAGGSAAPAQTAAEVEDLLRAILKDATCGHLGSDLRAAADEILLADGLAVGDGAGEQRGETAEWDLDAEEEEQDRELEAMHDFADGGAAAPQPAAAEEPGQAPAGDFEEARQVPERAGRITVHQIAQPEEDPVFSEASSKSERTEQSTQAMRVAEIFGQQATPAPQEPADAPAPSADSSRRVDRLLEERSVQRDAVADRVASLFPRPETTEWNVRELSYDRRKRAQVRS